MILTFNPLQAVVMPCSLQKFKVNGQLVPKIEWKEADGKTDLGNCITSVTNGVGSERLLTPDTMSMYVSV